MNRRRTEVKVCGITSLEDARFLSGAMADYLGFIFHEPSPRAIDPARAGAIINWIEGPETVGVFVNHPLDELNEIVRQCGLDMVQLHGTESPDYCHLIEKPVIKVIHVEDGDTPDILVERAEMYLSAVDYLMFDHRIGEQWGGTGEPFDWSLLSRVSRERPIFLSGGLNPDNIAEAIRAVQPFAVDVNSGLELEPGVKDYDKVDAFFEQMRELEIQSAEGESE
ncbi:MAG: phosphoribosylanthranilate isomerase [Balneolaceae bacterium]